MLIKLTLYLLLSHIDTNAILFLAILFNPVVAMTKSNLLIFGATGAIGSYITAAITDARDEFGRIGNFTSQSTLTKKTKEINALREKAVDILVGDVTSKDEVLKAFDGIL
jgi:FlaA1/EpsC-like NDP-sugar epimerase